MKRILVLSAALVSAVLITGAVVPGSATAVEAPAKSPGDKPPATNAPADKASGDNPGAADARALRADLAARIKRGNSEALTYLAAVKEQGDEAEPADLAAAYDLYEQAGQMGNPIAVKKMCLAYLLGEGRPKDVARAAGFCNKVDAKDPVTFFWGGYDYQFGVSGPKDLDSAKAAYAQAFEGGSGEAADAIGQMAYAGGHLDVAHSWFRRGVYLGSADAMDHLAGMAEHGQASPRDMVEATWLYGLAAARGNAHAMAWKASHPELKVAHSVLKTDKAQIALTHTYGTGTQQATEPLTSDRIALLMHKILNNIINSGYEEAYRYAHFECYIGLSHEVEACAMTREFPPGFGMSGILHAIWDGRISAPDRDAAGNPMAQTVFSSGVAIYLSR